MDFAAIRRLTIIALFSDDELYHQLVLKGGNALTLLYGLSPRSSLDLDFSIDSDFADLDDTRRRISHALQDRFASVGYDVFDLSLEPKPQVPGPHQQSWWGGYQLQFKLIARPARLRLGENPELLRRNALVTGPGQLRTFSVDLSKHEYCAGKLEHELDSYSIFVYAPEMIVIEKLRAICQQMPEYSPRLRPSARARDFYDIWCVVDSIGLTLDTPANQQLLRHIFAAKQVPLALLAQIAAHREDHRPDWPAVQAAVPQALEPFDFYFDFVLNLIAPLETLWVE